MEIRFFSKVVFLIAIMALGNALILQPALEIHTHKAMAHTDERASDESQCCFICHPSAYQGVAPSWPAGKSHLVPSTAYFLESSSLHSDPPVGSIFRPPLALL